MIAFSLALGAALSPRAARAQMGEPPCIGMPPLATLPVDPALPALPVAAVVAPAAGPAVNGIQHRELRGAWPAISGPAAGRAKCISVAMRRVGQENYEGEAIATLFPSARNFAYTPVGLAGEYCFRFVVLAADARSEFTERCADFPVQLPSGPRDEFPGAPAPPDAGLGTSIGDGVGSPLLLLAAGLAGVLAAAWTFGPAVVRRLFRLGR